MSFPKIPDITPKIDITLEEATNLLLSSIALEEISLSKLIDAETSKISHILHGCEHNDSVLQNAVTINKSVDDTVKNIIKLQMLLQFKLEKVQELIPITTTSTTTTTSSTTTTTSTHTTTTTTTKTTSSSTTSTTSTCSTTTHEHCWCNFTGKCKGVVENCMDEFNCSLAVLKAFVGIDTRNRSLSYTVQNDKVKLKLFASDFNIKMNCCYEKAIIYGKGSLVIASECEPEINTQAKFELRVWDKCDTPEFRIIITPVINRSLVHDSGTIKVCKKDSDFSLNICCR